jgi:hypothetical protein
VQWLIRTVWANGGRTPWSARDPLIAPVAARKGRSGDRPRTRGSAPLFFALVCFAAVACSGPVNFGVAEFKSAVAARNLKWKVKYEVTLDPPESYRIEPYRYGGAHVTGGDLRGLMYGLLEAADEVRATGRLKQVHAAPATPIRGVRLFARDADFDDERWRAYFQTLARDRFNRFTLIFTEPPRDLNKLRAISQAAADYAVDFTLALWAHQPDAALDRILVTCPLIRTVQIRNTSHDLDAYQGLVFKPLLSAGRRVALDPEPELVKAAQKAGIAVRSDPPSWPPGFDIDGPRDFEQHTLFYFIFGRTAYDPLTRPPHDENLPEFKAAAHAALDIASTEIRANDWTASIAEAVENAVEGRASAKRSPVETIALLNTVASQLEPSNVSDFQLLGRMARDRAEKLQASYDAELSGRAVPLPNLQPRPQIAHTPVKSAKIDEPIEVTLQINSRSAISVRLHYRPLTSTGTKTIEKPAAASVSFTIPPADSDLIYYFEILNRENGGWFEPDPFTTTPYYVVRIEPKPPVQ